jgi:hypothetical protein
MDCVVSVDFSLPTKGTLISLALSPSSTGTLAQPIAEETQPSHPTS